MTPLPTSDASAPPSYTAVDRVRNGIYAAGSALIDTLSVFWICLVYAIPGLILLGSFIVVLFSFPLVLIAGYGAVVLLTGNSILRAANLTHYTTNAVAAEIGAIGSVPSVLLVLSSWVMYDDITRPSQNVETRWPIYVRLACSVVASTLAGPLGCRILEKTHANLHSIDSLHATRAGVLGGVILALLIVVTAPFVYEALAMIASPVAHAMLFEYKWLYDQAKESWNDRGAWVTLYCCGPSGGRGYESDIELAQIPQHHK